MSGLRSTEGRSSVRTRSAWGARSTVRRVESSTQKLLDVLELDGANLFHGLGATVLDVDVAERAEIVSGRALLEHLGEAGGNSFPVGA